ncbi:MAG: response regulator [Deltaproteobacteria bacterium]|nr:response regulator [Deltaproteobacteria bacterium]
MTSLRAGHVQQHGALLAIDDRDLVIVAASENTEAILGVARVVGGGIAKLIESPSERELRDLLAGELQDVTPIEVRTRDHRTFDAMMHRAHGLVIVELEPATTRVRIGRIDHALARVRRAQDTTAAVLAEIAQLTGMAKVELQPGARPACFIADRAAAPVALVGSEQLNRRTNEITGVQLGAYDVAGTGALLVLDAGDHAIVCEHPEPRHVEVTARLAAQIVARALPSRTELQAAPAQGDLSGAKVLVVDDDPDQADMLALLLETAGAVTLVSHSAGEALTQIAAFHPDVVISDISLPDLDGFSFMRRLRALGPDEGGWVPAIALSGHADADHVKEAILAGFQLYMAKPIEPPDLVAHLVRLVGRTARRT